AIVVVTPADDLGAHSEIGSRASTATRAVVVHEEIAEHPTRGAVRADCRVRIGNAVVANLEGRQRDVGGAVPEDREHRGMRAVEYRGADELVTRLRLQRPVVSSRKAEGRP